LVSKGSAVLQGHCGILRPSQWNVVRRIRLEALSKTPDAFLGDFDIESDYDEEYWRGTFETASWHVFIAADAPMPDRIAGIARSSILDEFPDERYVESFWVRPHYRHQQVGRRMLHSIEREARRELRSVVRLSVLRKNQEAIRAFQSLGLSAVVEARSSKDEICLELPLT
jgi:ribosomal protein S18 acetylase RimI-like enzyme